MHYGDGFNILLLEISQLIYQHIDLWSYPILDRKLSGPCLLKTSDEN